MSQQPPPDEFEQAMRSAIAALRMVGWTHHIPPLETLLGAKVYQRRDVSGRLWVDTSQRVYEDVKTSFPHAVRILYTIPQVAGVKCPAHGLLSCVDCDPASSARHILEGSRTPPPEAGCRHQNTRTFTSHLMCTDCYSIRTDSQWGPRASNRWFKSLTEAKNEAQS